MAAPDPHLIYDCVVVGSGNAGFCAAHAAIENGCTKVLIVDKCPEAWAGGNGYFTAGALRTVHGGLQDLLPIVDNVTPEMTIAKEEIFGPVLSVIRMKTLDDAINLVNQSPFGNATSIFTSNGKSAREYSSRIEVGMVGVNVGVAAPMAFFPFAGWKNSFFSDLHAHGKDAVMFYTEQKVLMTRWF